MNHASLFSGIGGFDLAAEWMGWSNLFSCEKDEKANAVLEKRFPDTIHHRDIFELDATQYEGRIDILNGGFPCQPFSLAGKRKGENDDRYLWPQMLRIIRESKPTYVVGENVFGLVNMENGKTLESIYIDLENEGYTIESFIIPACAVKAWHRRDRIWIIAYRSDQSIKSHPSKEDDRWEESEPHNGSGLRNDIMPSSNGSASSVLPDSNCKSMRYKSDSRSNQKINKIKAEETRDTNGSRSQLNPNTTGIGSQKQGKPRRPMHQEQNTEGKINRAFNDSIWATESRVGRVADGIPRRVDRLKQLGNAIVPQLAFRIFKIISHYDQEQH